MMEQDGQNAYYTWGNLNTFWDIGDMLSGTIGRGANHPKIYVDKWHHAMWPDPYGGNKGNCATAGRFRFRMNDWYMFDLENGNLASIDRISPSWAYGKATNPHATSAGICTKKTINGEFGFLSRITEGGGQVPIADSHEYPLSSSGEHSVYSFYRKGTVTVLGVQLVPVNSSQFDDGCGCQGFRKQRAVI